MKSLAEIRYANDIAYIEYLLKELPNVGGFTLDNVFERKKYSEGYQVSVKDMFMVPFEGLTADKLLRKYLYVMSQQNELQYDIGLWLDDDIIYIDFSTNIQDFDDAQEVGRQHDQQMIYGWAEDDIFPVRY